MLFVEAQDSLSRNSAEKCSAKSGPMTLGKARHSRRKGLILRPQSFFEPIVRVRIVRSAAAAC